MFQTRRALRKKIEQLEWELSAKKDKEAASAFLDKSPLPKCKSIACANCEHVIYHRYRGRLFVLGCGKNCQCSDFKKSELSAEDRLLLRESIISQCE